MRTIKFRAWDTFEKRWLDKDELFISVLNGKLSGWQADCPWEIMQFTGLTDKNGLKEIYEGDIVKGINLENFEWIEPVTFIDNGWFPFIEHRAMTDFEVIGNIYEDAHLLDN